jgi:hypothetical protein
MSELAKLIAELKPDEAAVAEGFCKAVGAAAGVATWKKGRKWIDGYFKDHGEIVIEKANVNASDFLDRFAAKVTRLEEENEITKAIIEETFNNPSFAALLEQSMIGAAKTESEEKHEYLARLLSQRIDAPSESVLSLVSPLASEAIVSCNTTQLMVLGFISSTTIVPNLAEPANREHYLRACEAWLSHRYAPYRDWTFGPLDLMHLEAVSCLNVSPIGGIQFRELLIAFWSRGDFLLTEEELFGLEIGAVVKGLWEEGGLKSARLTSVGMLLGTLVSDKLCGADETKLDGWK